MILDLIVLGSPGFPTFALIAVPFTGDQPTKAWHNAGI